MSRTALVLCGGRGTRFRKVSESPKILATVNGIVFLDWILEYLANNGFSRIVLSIGYKKEEIISYVDKIQHKFEINVEFSIEDEPLGTGGALCEFFNNFLVHEVVVFNGDTIWFEKLPKKLFEDKLAIATCLTSNVKENDRYGDFKIVDGELRLQKGTTNDIIENSDVFIGIARISREITNNRLTLPFSLEELLAANKYGIRLVKTNLKFADFGTVDAYRKLSDVKIQ